ncbi:MAG: hypothetical protein ABI645_02200 [Pseudomonadota bacterium]
MKPSGLKEVERAKSDGRWKDAYDSARSVHLRREDCRWPDV